MFYDPLPVEYTAKLKATKSEEKGDLQYMYEETDGFYYQDSVVMGMKGSKIELRKIVTTFTSTNFSYNFFEERFQK